MNERAWAYKILLHFQRNLERLDKIEKKVLTDISLSTNQNRHLKNLVSGTLRHKNLLDWYIEKLFTGDFKKLIEKAKTLLRIGIYEILYMDHIPEHATVNECVTIARKQINPKTAGLINAILRSFLRQREALLAMKERELVNNPAIAQSFPKWLINRWVSYWGASFTEELCAAFNELPVFNIRVNQQKITTGEFEKLLVNNSIEYTRSTKNPLCYHIKKISEINKAGFFKEGLCAVQDESAMIPAELFEFKKEDTFLDVCAAPGGKFTQVLEQHPNLDLAVAVDIDADRLKRVRENLGRLQLKGFIVAADANHLPFKIKFTKILIDAPCSGQGVIGKHPDIKWRRAEKEIKEFTKLQKDILNSITEYVGDHGDIVYSTCSIDTEENEHVVNAFLESNSEEYSLVNDLSYYAESPLGSVNKGFVRTFPNRHETDGSFACLITKK